MPEDIAAYEGFCDWLIAASNCPCWNRAPSPTECLSINLDSGVRTVICMCRRPRARRSRRRHARTMRRGKTSDPDPDGGPGSSSRMHGRAAS